jgi:hypothetical protein
MTEILKLKKFRHFAKLMILSGAPLEMPNAIDGGRPASPYLTGFDFILVRKYISLQLL